MRWIFGIVLVAALLLGTGNSMAQSDCCIPHDEPGCDDPTCQDSVCSYDPFCCIYQWDATCASEASLDPNCDCSIDGFLGAPGSVSGNTCDSDDCDLRPSLDLEYVVYIPFAGEWVFSLCNSNFDTYLYLGTTPCSGDIASNDDFCGFQSQITVFLTPGTYYVTVEGYSEEDCGDFVLEVFPLEQVALAGTTLFGAGQRSATVRYDVLEPPPTIQSGGSTQPFKKGGARTSRAGENRTTVTEKGSLLIWPKIELRWNSSQELVQDTFVTLNNDQNGPVDVQLYLVSEPCQATDNLVPLTKNEPAYWSSLTGLPKGVSPFTVLGDPYPDPEGSGDYILRGYLLGWAVGAEGEQIVWNHLYGGATIVDYRASEAWEYNAYAFQVVDGTPEGTGVGTPGTLNLNGTEYDSGFANLLLDFFAVGSDAFGMYPYAVSHDTDLTLLILDNDLRQDGATPPITKAKFDIWNANETGLSGLAYCIQKWDERLLSVVGGHFLVENLQTDKGRARITGMASTFCDYDSLQSVDTSLVGVAVKVLNIVPAGDSENGGGPPRR